MNYNYNFIFIYIFHGKPNAFFFFSLVFLGTKYNLILFFSHLFSCGLDIRKSFSFNSFFPFLQYFQGTKDGLKEDGR